MAKLFMFICFLEFSFAWSFDPWDYTSRYEGVKEVLSTIRSGISNEILSEEGIPVTKKYLTVYNDTGYPTLTYEIDPKSDMKYLYVSNEFNSAGNMLKTKYYNRNNKIDRLIEYTPTGKISRISNYDGSGSIYITITYIYDSADKRIREIRNMQGMVEETIFSYGSRNELLTAVIYRLSGVVSESFEYVYDNQGREVEIKSFGDKNKFIQSTIISYDDNGNIIEQKIISRDGKIFYQVTYEYNERGDMIKALSSITTGKDQFSRRIVTYEISYLP